MKARQKWGLPVLNNRIRRDLFLLIFQKFWKFVHHINCKILFHEKHTKLNKFKQRRYLCGFSVKTVIKVDITLLHSVIL